MAAQENKKNLPRPSLDIVAFCQSCGTKHAFDPSVVGQKAKCLTCGHVFRVVDTRKDQKRSRPAKTRTTSSDHSRRPPSAKPAREPPPNDNVEFDPLEELARSEGNGVNEISGRRAPPDDDPADEADVIASRAVDPQASVTVLGIMLGMFYLALVAIGFIVLHAILGVVLAIWIVLPLAAVHGRKGIGRIVFLLSGRAAAA